MNNILSKFWNILPFSKDEPTKIGLSQFKAVNIHSEPIGPSLKKKDVKLSDLMRRVG